MSKAAEILSQYSYNQNKPRTKAPYIETYDATHKETNLPYTLKIVKNPQPQLEEYLKKLKETVSEYTVKIY